MIAIRTTRISRVLPFGLPDEEGSEFAIGIAGIDKSTGLKDSIMFDDFKGVRRNGVPVLKAKHIGLILISFQLMGMVCEIISLGYKVGF